MAKQKVIIRVDGNSNIGLGHIYRGIALAEMLKNDFDVNFITESTSTISPISDANFKYEFIPTNIELLDEPFYFNKTLSENTIIVLDGYDFTEEYQQKIKDFNFKLVYIDDLAKGTQKADLVINHSPGIKKTDYKTENYTKLALGLNYALLRQSFINFDRSNIKPKTETKNILVSFGGADPKDFTYKTVAELLKIDKVEQINVILGAAYKHVKLFEINNIKLKIHKNLSEKQIFEIMLNSDLAIVPASTTGIELASIGTPMLLGYFVNNQKGIYRGLIKKEGIIPLGDFNNFNFRKIELLLKQNIRANDNNIQHPQKLILKEFYALNLKIREINAGDMDFVFNLSNEDLVRENSYNSEPIQYEHHKKWFNKQLLKSKELFFILEYNNKPCGQIRFVKEKNKSIIGISISNKFRRKGIATSGLILACNKYFENNKEPIFAYIKKTNIASVKSFEKAGFIYNNDEFIKGYDSFVYIKNEKNENR